jgi:predicted Fe-Mo cluster-binding NifX family protein
VKVGVTSQNFRNITGHAGKTRRFLVYETRESNVSEIERLDLPKEMAMHEFRGVHHPLDDLDALITGGCGEGFVRRMSTRGVRVVATSEKDPMKAVRDLVSGRPLPRPLSHEN